MNRVKERDLVFDDLFGAVRKANISIVPNDEPMDPVFYNLVVVYKNDAGEDVRIEFPWVRQV